MVSQKYDLSMKCLAEIYPQDFAKFIFGPEFKGSVEFRPETLPIVSARESDLLLLIKETDTGKEFILHIEFQSTHESDIPERMLEYYARIVRHYKIRDVYPVVIYLNPKYAPKEIPTSYEHKFKGMTALYTYKAIKIWEIDSNIIIDNKLYGLFPLLSLTKDCDLKKCYNLIESLDIDYNLIKELYACAFLLAGIIHPKELIKSLTKEEIMLESVTYQEIIKKGIVQGIEKGKEQDILLVLNARFKKVPKSIAKKISAIDDLSRLEELLKVAATAKDLKEFKKHLS